MIEITDIEEIIGKRLKCVALSVQTDKHQHFRKIVVIQLQHIGGRCPVRSGMTVKFFDGRGRKDLRIILNALYLYIIMYINLRALWLLSVLRNYATI